MSLAETLIVLSVLADPTPYPGYGWQVEEQLANREQAATAQQAAGTDRERRIASSAIAAAEARLAALLNVKPQPPAVLLDVDGDWFATA